MSLTVKISASEKFSGMEQAVGEAIRKAVRDTTEAAAEIARTLAPVDTGALKDSITTFYQGNQFSSVGTIDVGVPYGIYQELGTRNMAAHPFLTPAIDAVSQQFQETIKQYVEQGIETAPNSVSVG